MCVDRVGNDSLVTELRSETAREETARPETGVSYRNGAMRRRTD